MAAKVWTCTLLSCSFTYIRGAPVVSYVYMPPRSTAMVVFEKYHVTYYALDMRIYNTVLIYLNIYNLSNITCHHHNFCVRNRSRLHIMRVWHPRQRAGIAMACPLCTPAASLAHRATASCTPIVHSQLPAWPIRQPPAARPLCIRPAASLAHWATASCTPIVHPPSCQPGPSGNRQLHAQLTPIGHPPSCQPGPSGNRQLHARLTLSCTVNSRAAPGPPFSADASTPLPSPLELMTYQPFPPTSQMKTKPGCQCLNVGLINCELLLIVGMISV